MHHHLPMLLSSRILDYPFSGDLIEALSIVLVLIGNCSFDGIIWLWLTKHCANKLEHIRDLVGRLPLFWSKHAKTHSTSIVIGHIWVVDLRAKGEDWWLEWVFLWQSYLDSEFAAL